MLEPLFQIQSTVAMVLGLALLATTVFAFVDALRHREDAYRASGKMTKPRWLLITGLAAVFALLGVRPVWDEMSRRVTRLEVPAELEPPLRLRVQRQRHAAGVGIDDDQRRREVGSAVMTPHCRRIESQGLDHAGAHLLLRRARGRPGAQVGERLRVQRRELFGHGGLGGPGDEREGAAGLAGARWLARMTAPLNRPLPASTREPRCAIP